MPGFESIKDQERPIRILTTLLLNGTLPHALLFAGTDGVGKKTTAKALAMACNCSGEASRIRRYQEENQTDSGKKPKADVGDLICGRCAACLKIESHSHPDVIQIKPQGNIIKIAQIRDLCQILLMKPYEARIRVVVISQAEKMNPAAGNALLKVLEEPPQQTMLILITAQPYDLLPTIVSRCQMIRFNPISRDILESLLVEQHGVPAGDAKLIAAMANGSLTRALTMVRSNWIRRRNWIIQGIEALSSQPVSRILLLAEKLAGDKEALPQILESAQSWLRDLAIYPYCPDQVVNYDLPSKCRHSLESSNLGERLEQFQTLAAAHNQLQTNVAVRLLLEKALLRLRGVEGPAHSTVQKQP